MEIAQIIFSTLKIKVNYKDLKSNLLNYNFFREYLTDAEISSLRILMKPN